LEEILPVDMDLSRKKEMPSLALVTVIDKSSSMSDTQSGVNKMELAKEAAIRSTEALRDSDFIGVAAFDNAASWVVEIQQAANRKEIQEAIGTIQPGGGTNLYPGLNLAYQALQNADTALKHVIVLTDGHTAGGNFESLISQMTAEGITVSGVAVGQDADSRLMERIAELGNGRYYFTDDFAGIPKIFTKETYIATRSYINNETFFPRASGSSPILRGIDSVPSLDGYITTAIKGGAIPVLVSHQDDDPVLAYWDYGLGKVAAWTSDARGIWTENWLHWDKAAAFWLNTISFVLPGISNREGKIETSRNGNMGQVMVSMDELDTGYDTFAVIVSPGGGESRIKMQPSRPGYYQGNFELDDTGVYLIRVEQHRDDGSSAAMEAGLIYPYSPEYDIRQTSSRNLSEHIAGQTGGRMLQNPEDILPDDSQPVWQHHEIWPALLLLALILFFLDIALRKLGLRFVKEKLFGPPIRKLTGVLAHLKSSNQQAGKKPIDENESIISESYSTETDEKSDEKRNEGSKGKQKSSQKEEQADFTSALLEARRKSRIRK
ncbi:MAG: VWA domain-containing protein, partial [Caldicoprobacterales bacterium]